MKDIYRIGIDLEKASQKMIENLKKAQQETAEDIRSEASNNAPRNTEDFANSIKVDNTEYDNNKISTLIASDKVVTTKDGKEYNLGKLLETGTDPHAIPNAFGWGDIYGKDSEQYKRTLQKDWHPGTIAYNFYHNALVKNKTNYRNKIKEAIKEAMK